MKIVSKFQEGGQAPVNQSAENGGIPQNPNETQPSNQGGNPEEQIIAIAQDIIQQMGPEAAGMLAQVIMEMLQGGGQPQPQPAFQRKGGSLVRKN